MTDQEKLKKLVYLIAEYADNMTAVLEAQKVAIEDLRAGLSAVDPAADEMIAPENQ